MIDMELEVQSTPEQELLQKVNAVKQAWAVGSSRPDARAWLDSHPSLLAHRSVVVDLAYDEFCRRRAAGETIDPDEFSERFPNCRSSLRHLIGLDGWLQGYQELIPSTPTSIWPQAGAAFGEHTVVRELGKGQGAFARVYLATEQSTGDRPVVLKLTLDDNPEAKTQGRLSHENIVPVLYARRHESGFSIVCMPYFGSATLHDVLDQAYPKVDSKPPVHARVMLDAVRAAVEPGDPAPKLGEPAAYLSKGTWVEAVARLGERLASALATVHDEGIFHRDIKPSNILIDAAGQPRLLDFNLSEDNRLEGARCGGTLPYMAPEQIRLFLLESNENDEPDGRADLYALGVILYELLTGQHPCGPISLKMKPAQLARLLLERQQADFNFKPVRELNPLVNKQLAALVESCLAYEVADRPADAATLGAELRKRFAPKRRARVLAGAASVLVLLAAGFVAYPLLAPVPTQASAVAAAQEYERGCKAFDEKNYHEAEEHFKRGSLAHYDHVPTLFARGRTSLQLGIPAAAASYFNDASQLRNDSGEIWAARAFAELLNQVDTRSQGAIAYSIKAQQHGVATKAVLNNRAYAHIKRNEIDEAKHYLDRVLGMDPDYLPARLNRAFNTYQIWLVESDYAKNPAQPISAVAAADIDAVLVNYPQYAELQVLAAGIYNALLPPSPQAADAVKGREHLTRAVLLGKDKEALKRVPLYDKLGKVECRQMFEPLKVTEKEVPLPQSLRIENPIQGWLE